MERDLANTLPTPVQQQQQQPSPSMRNKGQQMSKIQVTEQQQQQKDQSFDRSADSSVELAAFTPSSPTRTVPSSVMVRGLDWELFECFL